MPIPPISITAFGGEVPAIDERLLEANQAASSVNAWLLSGRIEPIRSLQEIYTIKSPTTRSWFRLPKGQPGIDQMAGSWWLEFPNEFVRVIRSPVVGQDDNGRYYWADGNYPKYMTGDMIAASNAEPPPDPLVLPFRLGVPAPTMPPLVVPSGGVSVTLKTVTYVYTWVTSLGEEGPPSPPSELINDKIDAIYTVTTFPPSEDERENRDITDVRIYRTITSSQGIASYFFVHEQPIDYTDPIDNTYADNCAIDTDSVIAANEQLQSTTWFEPPDDLQGLVSMPNGMVAAWRKNEVWFCEPYYPHAWPAEYVIAVDADIVGLGVHNQTLIILTDGQPYGATGIRPGQMALTKIQPLEPCTSRRSIVNTPNGVLYSSPNGLINITAAGAQNLTIDVILKGQWAERINLPTVMASVVAEGYYAYAGRSVGVFQADAFQNDAFQEDSVYGRLPGVFISLRTQRLGITTLDPLPTEVINIVQDIFNGETMILRDDTIYVVDIRNRAPYAAYRWRSKIFTLPYLGNLGAAKIYWTPQDASTGKEPTTLRVFAAESAADLDNGLTLKFSQPLNKPSGQMYRLPSGYKAQYYQVEVEGYKAINAIHMAQTAHLLRSV